MNPPPEPPSPRSRQTEDQADNPATNPAALRPAGFSFTYRPSSAIATRPSSSEEAGNNPTQSTTKVATDDWDVFAADLAATLPDLHPDQVCTVRVPRAGTMPAPVKVGFVRGLLDAMHLRQTRDTDPFVQFIRMRRSLYGNCGGPADSDGWVRLTAEQQVGIEVLGWARATGKERNHWGYPNYCVYFPHAEGVLSRPVREPVALPYPGAVDLGQAVRLAIDTLRGPLGADTPRKLTVIRGT